MKNFKKISFLAVFIFIFSIVSAQKFENLALTPPMGWNSWNKYHCDVSETLIMQMADAMVSSGMKDVGYEYIVIDDCWQVSRDEKGDIVIDKDRFPHGMKYLSDYVHSKGLKFGIYSCAGTETCAGRPGSRGYEYQDARMYASWGVDYLKYDWCNSSTQNGPASYATMRDALYKAGRPVVFSICDCGRTLSWTWGQDVGHLWRTTQDIGDNWSSMISIFDQQKDLARYSVIGGWNDPDMLEVGNGGMTTEEYKTHFSLWCMLAAPLIAGNDLSDMTPETKAILMNKEMIDVDQDSLGVQATCYRDMYGYQIWAKRLSNNEQAICLLNKSDEKKTVLVDFSVLAQASNMNRRGGGGGGGPRPPAAEGAGATGAARPARAPREGGPGNAANPQGQGRQQQSLTLADYRVRDLWEHKDLTLKENSMYVELLPHSVKVYRFVRK